jgi:hypothetical protein
MLQKRWLALCSGVRAAEVGTPDDCCCCPAAAAFSAVVYACCAMACLDRSTTAAFCLRGNECRCVLCCWFGGCQQLLQGLLQGRPCITNSILLLSSSSTDVSSTAANEQHASDGFHQNQQLLRIRSGTGHVRAAVLSTCSSSSSRCSAHSLHAEQHSHLYAATELAVIAGNSISLASFPWLLQRGAARQFQPPPAATEDVCSAGAPLQDSSRGGSSRQEDVSRGRDKR